MMTDIKEQLKKASELARISLTEEELNKFLPQITEVLEMFTILDEANTSNTECTVQPIASLPNKREDELKPSMTNSQALSNTKHKEAGYIKGPRVI